MCLKKASSLFYVGDAVSVICIDPSMLSIQVWMFFSISLLLSLSVLSLDARTHEAISPDRSWNHSGGLKRKTYSTPSSDIVEGEWNTQKTCQWRGEKEERICSCLSLSPVCFLPRINTRLSFLVSLCGASWKGSRSGTGFREAFSFFEQLPNTTVPYILCSYRKTCQRVSMNSCINLEC